jgi:hypothetical protein
MYPNDLMRQVNAARLRGVTPAAIAELISRGRLKTYEIDGVHYVSRREVLKFERQKPVPKPRDGSAAKSAGFNIRSALSRCLRNRSSRMPETCAGWTYRGRVSGGSIDRIVVSL